LIKEKSFAPWGLVMCRDWAYDVGGGPCWPVRNDLWPATVGALDARSRTFCVRLEPGMSEWLHEKEWRIPVEDGQLHLPPDAIMGVIVGERGWCPAKEGFDDPPWWDDMAHYIWNGDNFGIEAPGDWPGWRTPDAS
jgi:hypothetical protein